MCRIGCWAGIVSCPSSPLLPSGGFHSPCSAQDLGGSAWKGRGPQLADVVRLYLAHKHDASVGIILQLAQEYLPMVGGPANIGCCFPGPTGFACSVG